MEKFSVKKPLTIFVAVIAVLVLGVVAFTKMTPDLLPNMDFPYVVIVTTYPGASPEKVETEITKPMEQVMSTLEHIKEVSSTSSENYSMVILEFEDAVNLDTVGVDIQQNINTLTGQWDDMISEPYMLKINPSVLAVEVAAVSMDGMSTVELTEFLDNTLLNKLEGISGVAQVSTSGMIQQEIHVVLNQTMMDALNKTISDTINQQMDETLQELTEQQEELQDAQEQLQDAQEQLAAGGNTLANQTAAGEAQISGQQSELLLTRIQLQDQLTQLQTTKQQLESVMNIISVLQSGLEELELQETFLTGELDILRGLESAYAGLQRSRAGYDEQLQRIYSDTSLTPEQIEAAALELEMSPAFCQMEADLAQLHAQAAAFGGLEAVPQQISTREITLRDLRIRIRQMQQMLEEQGLDPESIVTQIEEMLSSLSQIDDGIAALEDAITQLDAGMLQLQDAQKLLSAQKTAGLLQMSSAATELALNSATVSAALTQIEEGLTALEEGREMALEQANLNEIVTMEMVTGILTAQSFYMPAGYLEQDGVNYMVSVGEEITRQADLENLMLFDLGMEGIDPIYLKDVAVVMLTDNRGETYAKLNGQDSVVLSFQKQSSYATAETTDNINARFRELEEEYPGLHFVALMNQGDYIYLIVETIMSSLLLGAVFAVIVLYLFLRDLRPTFITLCSIPISVIFAIVLMYFSGVTINMISLSGLAVAVGMLVDNSVVVIENIYRLRAKGANVIQAAVSGAGQVAGAVTASTLTTVCVFLPIVFVEGLTRQLFTDLALTMTYSLMASLIVSLTLVPAMAAGMLRNDKNIKQNTEGKFMRGYHKVVAWALDHKALTLGLASALLLCTCLLSLVKGFTFMPTIDMPNVNVTITMPEDATMEEAVALSDQVLERIDTIDGIASSGAMMSSGGVSLMGGAGGAYDVTVYINLEDEGASGAAVGKQIEELCQDLDCTVSASSAMMDMSMLTGSGVQMQIYCDDMQTLQQAAQQAAQILEGVDGVREASDGLEDTSPALHIGIDRNEAMKNGLTVAQIYMELAGQLTTTTTAATLNLDNTSTSVIIEKPEGAVLDLAALESYEFQVTGMDGETKTVKLSDFAEIQETMSLNAINRLSQRRYLTVTGVLEEGYNVTLVTGQAQRAMDRADLGAGVSYVFTGENEMIMEAIEQLLLMLLLGVLLVYLVMVAQFQSLKSPFIVMFTIPLAFTGGFIALLVCGMELSVISLIGFIMLTGIIVNNGIVLVDYINQLRLEGMERREAILDAGKTRLRPILMTSITTILGLFDMALSQNVGTSLMRPVAVVCIGGLLYATLMTLLVIPVIYDMFSKKELRNVREEDLKLLDI